MSGAPMVLPAMREDRGRFARLSGVGALVYWPHGLGDWVHLGHVLPLLEPSNRYAVTRFGDDYVSLMEGSTAAYAIFSGVRAPSDGSSLGAPHLGLRLRRCNGSRVRIEVPAPLDERFAAFAPDVLLWTDYPETEGRTAYPYHTKARHLASLLAPRERLAAFDLSQPLANAIDFAAPASAQRLVDERLAAFAPPGTRLCVISRTGVTAARKNWESPAEAEHFVAALRRDSPHWRTISMEDEPLGEGVAGFRALFGDLDEPFARLYKALAARIDLFVGIPAGPLHLTMARGGVPTVGLWLAHHPDWYDEPNAAAIHLVGHYVRERGFDRRPATLTKPSSLRHRLEYLDTRMIGHEAALEAAKTLLT
ncbi:MAG: hypothetical protein WA814_13075 [Candidatus Baltobacteraceae bacterium]